MYFWRIEELKRKHVGGSLTDREILPYFLIFVGLTALVTILPVESMSYWDYIGAIGTFLLTVFGTVYVYRYNGGATGSHFLQRYFSIGWVVAVRWSVIVMPLLVALLFLLDSPAKHTTSYVALFFFVAEVV